jgi:hypothetical protein
MKKISILSVFVFYTVSVFSQESAVAIDRETLLQWGKPYRGWHYYPDPVIPSDYPIPGAEDFRNFDVPIVYQLEGKPDTWYMSFIGFNKGYNSFVVESNDLIHWTNPKTAMGFGKEGEFDYGGCVIGAFLYESWDVKAPKILKKKDGLICGGFIIIFLLVNNPC